MRSMYRDKIKFCTLCGSANITYLRTESDGDGNEYFYFRCNDCNETFCIVH
jgi:hypothetical protein